ncbi:hypothetical protein HMPREF0379_0967 [[Eubacterium] yurii subsp. margaretiae ATCC 43715]|nr:hypothetical protein HMPREF0379_0967 [[Eubacterium] yurii subsp. margaretiae ATCC 43715]
MEIDTKSLKLNGRSEIKKLDLKEKIMKKILKSVATIILFIVVRLKTNPQKHIFVGLIF